MIPEGPLQGKLVFLAASEPTREPDIYPRLQAEVESAVIQLTRAVFTKGGRLVFGGHPTISPRVASVAEEYFTPSPHAPREQRPIQIYQSEAYRHVIPASTQELENRGYAAIHWTVAQNGERFDPTLKTSQCQESLRFMRSAMLKRLPIAMVAIGGMDGVAEEAGMFLLSNPGLVFALRTTGGTSSKLKEHTARWGRKQEVKQYAQFQRQIDLRMADLEDVFPAPKLPMVSEQELKTRPAAPYAFFFQKLIQELLSGRPFMPIERPQ
jgi:hypothetical protein